MTITLWNGLDDLDFVVGAQFPQADEDALRRSALAWAEAGRRLRELNDEAMAAGSLVAPVLGGSAGTSFLQLWRHIADGGGAGAIAELAHACEQLGDACEETAREVEYAKIEYIAALVLLAATIASLVSAAVGFGVSLSGIPVAIAAAQITIRAVIMRLITAIGVAVGVNVTLDATAQLIQIGSGHRTEWDWAKTRRAAEDGAIAGAITGGLLAGAGRWAPTTVQSPIRAAGVAAAGGAAGGVVAPLAHGEIPDAHDLAIAVTSGLIGGVGPELVHGTAGGPGRLDLDGSTRIAAALSPDSVLSFDSALSSESALQSESAVSSDPTPSPGSSRAPDSVAPPATVPPRPAEPSGHPAPTDNVAGTNVLGQPVVPHRSGDSPVTDPELATLAGVTNAPPSWAGGVASPSVPHILSLGGPALGGEPGPWTPAQPQSGVPAVTESPLVSAPVVGATSPTGIPLVRPAGDAVSHTPPVSNSVPAPDAVPVSNSVPATGSATATVEGVADQTPPRQGATPLLGDAEAAAVVVAHAFPTNAGIAFYAADDDIRDFARAVHPTDGFVTIDLHGSTRGFHIDGQLITPEQFARGIRDLITAGRLSLPEGDGIKLLSCHTAAGGADSPGARLARELGVAVVAPDKPVWTSLTGEEIVSSQVLVGGIWQPTRPPDGDWHLFLPADARPTPLVPDQGR